MFNLRVNRAFKCTSNKNFNSLTITNIVAYDDKKHTEISNLKFRKWIKNLEHYYFDILDYSEKRLKGGLL